MYRYVRHISELLGLLRHATITQMLDTYSHVILATHHDATAAIDAIVSAWRGLLLATRLSSK